MEEIMPYLEKETGRTTDFSYGGILMWVDYYKYEYAIYEDTLFVKGVVETNRKEVSFSLPVGSLPIEESIEVMRSYCRKENIPLTISAVPEEGCKALLAHSPECVEEMPEIADYLYEAESLAYLKGKKNGKKRNHVNQFLASYPEWRIEPITRDNIEEALLFMDKFELEGDPGASAEAERKMTREILQTAAFHSTPMLTGMLKAGEEVCAITVGDIKGDTLYIHIEKALREYPGSYEMINKEFARQIVESHPEIKYINREDDTGDEGLRKAKESYHPVALLKKYTLRFG